MPETLSVSAALRRGLCGSWTRSDRTLCCGRWSCWRTIPGPDGCRKRQGSDDAYLIQVGDYRVIYTVDDAVLVVAAAAPHTTAAASSLIACFMSGGPKEEVPQTKRFAPFCFAMGAVWV